MNVCVVKSRGSIAPQIMSDIASALKSVGVDAMELDYEAEGVYSAHTPQEISLCASRLVESLESFKPDFVFSYGAGGVINLPGRDGGASHLFEELGLRHLLMFYDAPAGGEELFARIGRSPLLHVTTWDRHHVEWFKSYGVERILGLPLGVNPDRFASPKASGRRNGVCFVGTLAWGNVRRGLPGSPPLQSVAKVFSEMKLESPSSRPSEILDRICETLPDDARAPFAAFRSSPIFPSYLQACMRYSDAILRRDAMRSIFHLKPAVYGDSSWIDAGIEGVDFRGMAEYGESLAEIYASSDVNINITNAQLESAVNQRVFDCPAAGGFLLTDWREGLDELFNPGSELAVFKALDELPELAGRYLEDAKARRSIAEAARRRTLSCHTWRHRMESLLHWLAG